jgi:hypothetical protein
MFSQSFAVDVDRESLPPAAQQAPAARPWHQRRWYQVILGCGLAVIGVSRLCNGLILLTGATNYGALLEVNHGNLYYTRAVSQEEAKALGAFLVKAEVFDGRHISIQLTREGQTTQVRVPLKEGFDKDEAYIASIRALGYQISQNVFHGAPVEVDLCDENLKTLRAVPGALTST